MVLVSVVIKGRFLIHRYVTYPRADNTLGGIDGDGHQLELLIMVTFGTGQVVKFRDPSRTDVSVPSTTIIVMDRDSVLTI